jgi:hypothetical protein
MQNHHSVAAHWAGDFEEQAFRNWVEKLRGRIKTLNVDLGLVFISPRLFAAVPSILEIIRVHGQEEAGLVLGLYSLPGARLHAIRFTQEQVEESSGPAYWQLENGVRPEETNGWLCFADPFRLDAESWLRGWNEAYTPLPILGGLASGDPAAQSTQVYLNGEVFEEGGVAISVGGEVALESVISQGCAPIGETWTITRTERNLIHEIGPPTKCWRKPTTTFHRRTRNRREAICSWAWWSTNTSTNFIAATFSSAI